MSSPIARYNLGFPRKESPYKEIKFSGSTGEWDFNSAVELASEVISSLGLDVMGEKKGHGGDHVFMLRRCAFDPSHTSNDAAIMVSQNGKLKYHCFHNSCANNGWKELRDLSGISNRQQPYSRVSINNQISASEGNCDQTTAKASSSQSEPSSCDFEQGSRAISDEIYKYITQGSGIFTTNDLDRELCLVGRLDKNARASALNRYKKQGLIVDVPGRRGVWRVVDGQCKGMKLGSAKAKPLAIALPLGLHELCDIRPGNIIVVAGSPNSGKSAYVSNLVHSVFNTNTKGNAVSNYSESVAAEMARQICPGQKLECHFFSSEAGEDEMSSRLELHPGGIDSFRDVQFWERDRDFADVIRPNALNIVDFLEVYDDFYQIGSWINDIHRVMDKGIAVVVIQKKRGRDVGKGGDVTMEKPRLYVSLENNAPYGGICKVVKAKFLKHHSLNPNGMEIDYHLIDGHAFRPTSDWRYVADQKERDKINKEHEAARSERGYMFNFVTVDGEVKGLSKRDVEKWATSYPRIYVIGELMQIEEQSRSKPFMTGKNWFFELSGILSRKNNSSTNYQQQ
jgi:hypothetical protein